MMKKQLLFLAMIMMPLFVACSSDDSDDGSRDKELISKAVGTWMCIQSTDSAMGISYDGLLVGKEVTINADGTYTSTAPTFGYHGTYTVSGNKITAKSTSGDTFVVTVTVNGDKMTWNGTASKGATFYYIFIRE